LQILPLKLVLRVKASLVDTLSPTRVTPKQFLKSSKNLLKPQKRLIRQPADLKLVVDLFRLIPSISASLAEGLISMLTVFKDNPVLAELDIFVTQPDQQWLLLDNLIAYTHDILKQQPG